MVCNVEKTELMTFGLGKISLEVGGKTVHSQENLKVLGLVFDEKLSWENQVAKTIKSASRTLHGMKQIRKYLDQKMAKQVITSYFFSILNYGLEIWFHPRLSFHLKRRIRGLHYRAMRLIYGKDTSKSDLIGLELRPMKCHPFLLENCLQMWSEPKNLKDFMEVSWETCTLKGENLGDASSTTRVRGSLASNV